MSLNRNDLLAVCISDIHFNINNLELATQALVSAIDYSNKLRIPLIIAGDLHDTKAIIRAEVANRLLELFDTAQQQVGVLVGNHDLISEKGSDHGLTYLNRLRNVVTIASPWSWPWFSLIPYQSSSDKFLEALANTCGIVICHQGVLGAFMGDYVQDKSSTDLRGVKDKKIISGHYHRHQTVGSVTYIGSPFTHTWGEANDGDKGFLVLHRDGSFHREILDLRKHIIFDIPHTGIGTLLSVRPQDLIWVKVRGPKSVLLSIDRKIIASQLGREDFKLDLVPDSESQPISVDLNLTDGELFDGIIDALDETVEHKTYLKQLWKDVMK